MQLTKSMTKTDWGVALLYASVIPVVDMINGDPGRLVQGWNYIIMTWLLVFSFNMVCWVINTHIRVSYGYPRDIRSRLRKVFAVVFANAVLVSGLILAVDLMFLSKVHTLRLNYPKIYLLLAFRGVVGIGLIYVIQTAIYSKAKAQEISLQNQMLKTENIRSQFEILKQQISPHFLFNSLATLHSMIQLNNPNSAMFVIKLSEMYRQLLVKRQQDLVTLKEELAFVNDYVFMLTARFDKMLKIKIDIPENIMQMKLPTFSLQLLLENCMKHNIVSEEKPLHIKIFTATPGTITVENNLQAKVTHGEKSGYGLENLDQRYNLLGYPDSVDVFSDDDTFRVTILLLNT